MVDVKAVTHTSCIVKSCELAMNSISFLSHFGDQSGPWNWDLAVLHANSPRQRCAATAGTRHKFLHLCGRDSDGKSS